MSEQKVWTNPIGAATAKAKDFDATLSMRQNNLDTRVARVKGFSLAKRLESCYMACAGIEDPAAALEAAREALRLPQDAENLAASQFHAAHPDAPTNRDDLVFWIAAKANHALKLLVGMPGR